MVFSVLRIEFNHSKSDYYTGIDAVLLVGTKDPIVDSTLNTILDDKLGTNIKKKPTAKPCKIGILTRQVYKLNLHHIPGNNLELENTVAPLRFTENVIPVFPVSAERAGNSSPFDKLPVSEIRRQIHAKARFSIDKNV